LLQVPGVDGLGALLVKLTVSRPWKPAAGKTYGEVELTLAPDFAKDNPLLWGVVAAMDLPSTTRFERLTVIGNRDWDPRWSVLATREDPMAQSGAGGKTALSAVHAIRSRLFIEVFEAIGFPGCGLIYEGIPPVIESGRIERCGWPIHTNTDSNATPVQSGGSVRNLTAIELWEDRGWNRVAPGYEERWSAVSMRRLGDHIVCPGELALHGNGYELVGFTQVGDGGGFRLSGTRFRVERAHVPQGYLGVDASSQQIEVVDSVFAMTNTGMRAHDCLRIDGPNVETVAVRRCTFVRGARTDRLYAPPRSGAKVAQLSTGSRAVFEECEFIGWADQAAAFELSTPAQLQLPGCRFWAS